MSDLNWIEEIEASIGESARKQHLLLGKLEDRDAELVREAVQRLFINGQPRVWWLGLSRPITEQYDRHSVDFTKILPPKPETCWLIPENERRPVYEVVQRPSRACYRSASSAMGRV